MMLTKENLFVICLLIAVTLAKAQHGLGEVISYAEYGANLTVSPFKKCKESPVPSQNDSKSSIPTYIINLDLPPEDRWKNVVTAYKPLILRFVDTLRNNTDRIFGAEIFKLIDKYLPAIAKTLPKEYYRELLGISDITGLPIGEITVFNVFYEFNSLCTSIVMEDGNGTMYHGRNLDFGFPFGWDKKNKTWLVTELLRPLVVKAEFQRNSQTLYTSVQFAGYIGVLTGIRKNAFAMSVNERFKLDGGVIGIIEWILGRRHQKWNGILTRELMESSKTYEEAQHMLKTSTLIAPVYFILSGTKTGEGSVVTRGRSEVDVWRISDRSANSSWYLVQTNYDHWKKPPIIDDRVVPSVICLELLGRSNPVYTLYNVLSTIPVLNKETIFSSVMEPATGDVKIWLQDCPDPCWPW